MSVNLTDRQPERPTAGNIADIAGRKALYRLEKIQTGMLLACYRKRTSLGDGTPPGQMAMSGNLTAAEARAAMEEAERLIDAIEPRTVANLRNRAIIGVMGYAWASVETVLAMQETTTRWAIGGGFA